MRAGLNQRFEDAFEYRFGLLKRLIVPEANHAKATARQVVCAFEIIERGVCVLSSIELDDQPRSHANEIHDVSTERHLSPKSITAQLPIAEEVPDPLFGIGRIRAKRAGVCEE